MPIKTTSARRSVAGALFAALLTLVAGLSAPMAAAETGNDETVNQARIEDPGEVSGDGGTALAGPATTFQNANVHQLNVQVAAGDEEALANSDQTATNSAEVNQVTAAASGDAAAADGGIARTGHALAGTLATVIQLNVQVMALLSPDCEAHQVASNQATINQLAGASSGDATADGSGSEAVSGDASTKLKAHTLQKNIQVHVCKPHSGGTSHQSASNTQHADQIGFSSTGEAGASSGSTATSGDADATNHLKARQSNRQIAVQ